MQGPAVAVDGHDTTQAIECASTHGVERNHVERVALPDRVGGLQGEEIMVFTSSADGVDIVSAYDGDGFVVKADTLHAVDQVDESRLFHAGHLGA